MITTIHLDIGKYKFKIFPIKKIVTFAATWKLCFLVILFLYFPYWFLYSVS